MKAGSLKYCLAKRGIGSRCAGRCGKSGDGEKSVNAEFTARQAGMAESETTWQLMARQTESD